MTQVYILKKSIELEKEIHAIDFKSLNLSPMGESYFQFNLGKLSFNNKANAISLYRIINQLKDKNIKDISVIDHGAGIGFFGLLAKKCGIGRIICHDISKDMIHDCKIISDYLGLSFDHYVVGDTDILLEYCKANNLFIDGFSSRNVIEHIPNLNLFFNYLSQLPHHKLVMMINTSANVHNPAVHRLHKKIHKEYEEVGSTNDMMRSRMDHERSGRKIRQRIILELNPEIESELLEIAIRNSRGLDIHQIEEMVKEIKLTGTVPSLIEKLSNTRDPYSGTWVERLVPFEEYCKIANQYGFKVVSLPGFYNQSYKDPFMKFAGIALNGLIKLLPFFHRTISPFLSMRFIHSYQ